MFSSMFSGEPEVAPGDYYDYDFIHETNDTDFLGEKFRKLSTVQVCHNFSTKCAQLLVLPLQFIMQASKIVSLGRLS